MPQERGADELVLASEHSLKTKDYTRRVMWDETGEAFRNPGGPRTEIVADNSRDLTRSAVGITLAELVFEWEGMLLRSTKTAG